MILASANKFDDSNPSQHGMYNQDCAVKSEDNCGDSAVQPEIEGEADTVEDCAANGIRENEQCSYHCIDIYGIRHLLQQSKWSNDSISCTVMLFACRANQTTCASVRPVGSYVCPSLTNNTLPPGSAVANRVQAMSKELHCVLRQK